MQWFLSARGGLPSGAVLLISSIACLIGLAGAKACYLGTHRSEHPLVLAGGMCIQGFVIAAIAVTATAVAIAAIPLGAVLDATALGLLFGMAIGRLGCFFGGCCAGRPSASRWAVWSSDRARGVRRIPVQLIESSMSAGIGVAALIAAAEIRPQMGGMIFLPARHGLGTSRAVSRTAHGRRAVPSMPGLVSRGTTPKALGRTRSRRAVPCRAVRARPAWPYAAPVGYSNVLMSRWLGVVVSSRRILWSASTYRRTTMFCG